MLSFRHAKQTSRNTADTTFKQDNTVKQENTCARVSFQIKLQASACNFIQKEAQSQVFPCKLYKKLKNNYLHRSPPMVASVQAQHLPVFKAQQNGVYELSYFCLLTSYSLISNRELHKKFSIKDFFSKCEEIRRKLGIWRNL